LDEFALQQIARGIHDADLVDDFFASMQSVSKPTLKIGCMYTLFVGLPTDTSDCTAVKMIENIIKPFVESYTITPAQGSFKTSNEKTFLISMATKDHSLPFKCGEALKNELNQDGIGILFSGYYNRITDNR